MVQEAISSAVNSFLLLINSMFMIMLFHGVVEGKLYFMIAPGLLRVSQCAVLSQLL